LRKTICKKHAGSTPAPGIYLLYLAQLQAHGDALLTNNEYYSAEELDEALRQKRQEFMQYRKSKGFMG